MKLGSNLIGQAHDGVDNGDRWLREITTQRDKRGRAETSVRVSHYSNSAAPAKVGDKLPVLICTGRLTMTHGPRTEWSPLIPTLPPRRTRAVDVFGQPPCNGHVSPLCFRSVTCHGGSAMS